MILQQLLSVGVISAETIQAVFSINEMANPITMLKIPQIHSDRNGNLYADGAQCDKKSVNKLEQGDAP